MEFNNLIYTKKEQNSSLRSLIKSVCTRSIKMHLLRPYVQACESARMSHHHPAMQCACCGARYPNASSRGRECWYQTHYQASYSHNAPSEAYDGPEQQNLLERRFLLSQESVQFCDHTCPVYFIVGIVSRPHHNWLLEVIESSGFLWILPA